jgi:hypothetical protein
MGQHAGEVVGCHAARSGLACAVTLGLWFAAASRGSVCIPYTTAMVLLLLEAHLQVLVNNSSFDGLNM